jgi:hypothetical protein
MEKRYQVFVSSTFRDLVEERRAVMQALLELDCIPAGMELFPASTDDQWTLIQRVIDDCDYYLVIVGGRYGSIDEQGISYTEREYDYAAHAGKPVMGFVHAQPGEIPVKNAEREPAAAAKLEAFREKVQRRMCKFWSSADELGGMVSRSYVQLLKNHPAEGWVKARYAKTTEDLEKVNQMHEQIRILEQELARLRENGAGDIGNLARGSDSVSLEFEVYVGNEALNTARLETSWEEVFRVVGRVCMGLPQESEVRRAVSSWIGERTGQTVGISAGAFDKIKVQMYSLGLIRLENQLRRVYGESQPALCWALTDAGRRAFAELLAEKRPDPDASSPERK